MQRLKLGSKTATKPASTTPSPTWGIGKLIAAPPPKPTIRTYPDTMSADRKAALEKIHSTSDNKHVLQLRLRTLKDMKGVDARREKDIKTLEDEIKALEDVIRVALNQFSPKKE